MPHGAYNWWRYTPIRITTFLPCRIFAPVWRLKRPHTLYAFSRRAHRTFCVMLSMNSAHLQAYPHIVPALTFNAVSWQIRRHLVQWVRWLSLAGGRESTRGLRLRDPPCFIRWLIIPRFNGIVNAFSWFFFVFLWGIYGHFKTGKNGHVITWHDSRANRRENGQE